MEFGRSVDFDGNVSPKQIDRYCTVSDCSFAISIIFSSIQNQDWCYFKLLKHKHTGPLPSVPGSSDPCLLRAKLFGQR